MKQEYSLRYDICLSAYLSIVSPALEYEISVDNRTLSIFSIQGLVGYHAFGVAHPVNRYIYFK